MKLITPPSDNESVVINRGIVIVKLGAFMLSTK